MKKRIALIVIFLTICINVFSEIKWLELTEDLKKDYTAMAACTKLSEVLEITHIDDLKPYFITYRSGSVENTNDYSVYLVSFTVLGFIIEEYLPHSKTVAVYTKTIFQ